jgi:hypothetical protein
MGSILLLEDIAKEALDKKKGYLFGKRNFVTMGDEKFDFFFHFLDDVPIEKFADSEYRIGLVMPYLYPKQKKQAKIEMGSVFEKNPFVSDFALYENDGVRKSHVEGVESIKTGNFLTFFHANPSSLGPELSKEDYSQINDVRLRKYASHYDALIEYLGNLREEIEETCNS